jgi:CheY-like chemotaxis protein
MREVISGSLSYVIPSRDSVSTLSEKTKWHRDCNSPVQLERSNRPMLEILYVEDNPADVFLLSTALGRIDSGLVLKSVGDGEAALEFLRSSNGCPSVIVLDLGLPRIDGVEVLSVVKSNPDMRHVPTVVFAERDGRKRIASAGCVPELILSKPMDLDGYIAIAKQIAGLCYPAPAD